MAYFDLNTHLDDLSLGQLSEHSSDDTGDSDIEVVSTVDENDHVLLRLPTSLNLDSKDDDEDEPESKIRSTQLRLATTMLHSKTSMWQYEPRQQRTLHRSSHRLSR